MNKVLWWIAGVDSKILLRLPTEQRKYSSIGLSILIASVIALFAGVYSFEYAFTSYFISILIGFILGMIVFTVHRSLIQISTPRQDKDSAISRIFKLAPMILVVLFMSIAIGYPLLFGLFKDEILQLRQTEIMDFSYKLDDRYQSEILLLKKENENNDSLIARSNDKLENALEIVQCECNGKCGTQIKGRGPSCKLVENEYRRISVEHKELSYRLEEKNGKNNERIETLLAQRDFQREEMFDIASMGGMSLANRISGLHKLIRTNSGIWIVVMFVLGLIILINSLPYFVKYFSNTNVYEEEIYKRQHKDYFDEKIVMSETNLGTHGKIEKYSFEALFQEKLNNISVAIENTDKKSGNLLLTGIVIILIGIFLYLTMIFFWLNEFHSNSFQTYHLFGIISTSILFIFVEFLGAWFLKQHRRCSSDSMYLLKLKTIIERHYLAYLFVKEDDVSIDSKKDLHKSLLDLLKGDFKFPSSEKETLDNSFASEAMDSIRSLSESVKKLSGKS